MAQRAHCVIVDDVGTRLSYSTWAAITLDVDLVAGPEAAFRQLRRRYDDIENLLESVWVEAAALIDVPRRVLVFFSWHCEGFAHRAALRAVLARTWPGWDVRWAYAGIDDIARYVGEPVCPTDPADRNVSLGPVDLSEPTGAAEFDQLVSVADPSGRTRAYAMWSDADDGFFAGPGLLDRLTDAVSTSTLPFLPESGLHLDPVARTAVAWSTHDVAGLVDGWSSWWPGWRLRFHEDRYESQLVHCGSLRVPRPTLDAGLDVLIRRVERISEPGGREYGGEPLDRAAVEAAVAACRELPPDPPYWAALAPFDESTVR